MDYSKMSDYEIAHMVSQKLPGRYITYADHVMDSETEETFDPCNNAADAWPIINASRISIMFDGTDPQYEGEHHEWCDAISSCQKFGIQHQPNPLRAAMVVYLMMQESANVQDNPAR